MKRSFLFLVVVMLLAAGCSTKKETPQQIVSEEPAIVLTEVDVAAIDSADCEVESDLDIAYLNASAGAEPKIWWQVVCGEASSMGFQPLNQTVQPGDKLVQMLDWKRELAPTSTCSGTCSLYLWVEDGDLKSEEWQGQVEFKE